MNADKIVAAATTVIAIIAVYKFLEHPSSRTLRTALIDLLGL